MSTNPTDRQKLVLLIHGIRTRANWLGMVAGLIEENTNVTPVPIKYGYFDVFRFWLPFKTLREQPIERVHKELREVFRKNPGAEVQVIAHSYGTQTICNILDKYEDIKLSRILLCGSVVKADFNWSRVSDQIGMDEDAPTIVNECGTKDIWPVLASSTTWGYGSTGTYGFGTYSVRDRCHPISHSEYFKEDFVRTYWIPFVQNGEAQRTDTDKAMAATPWWFDPLSLPIRWVIPVLLLWITWGVTGLTPWGERFQKLASDRSCTVFAKVGLVACGDIRLDGPLVIEGKGNTSGGPSNADIEADNGVAAGGDIKAGSITIRRGQ